MKIYLILSLFLFNTIVFAKSEIWECYKDDKSVLSVFKIDTDKPSIAWRSEGTWNYYSDVFYDSENNNMKSSGEFFDLVQKKYFILLIHSDFNCKVIEP